jgi:hypothetical protein
LLPLIPSAVDPVASRSISPWLKEHQPVLQEVVVQHLWKATKLQNPLCECDIRSIDIRNVTKRRLSCEQHVTDTRFAPSHHIIVVVNRHEFFRRRVVDSTGADVARSYQEDAFINLVRSSSPVVDQ